MKASKTKNALYTVFIILIALVLAGKVLNWILNFSDETNHILNSTMFILIGVAYIVVGFVWDNWLIKTAIITCGIFLIIMNFFESNTILNVIGIVCILTPMLIARFNKEKNNQLKVHEN
jgi:hypothetical protein